MPVSRATVDGGPRAPAAGALRVQPICLEGVSQARRHFRNPLEALVQVKLALPRPHAFDIVRRKVRRAQRGSRVIRPA